MSSLPWNLLSRRTSDEQETSQAPVNSPGHDDPTITEGAGAQTLSGTTTTLNWAARTDVGLMRSHNEDSFLAQAPTFAVCDGMGGHAAGEIASSIAVATIAEHAPSHADDLLLGAAVESANAAVIEGAAVGKGKVGMGCTASAVSIELDKMAVAHVGDSRVYLLHNGALVRLTHDHSYVEELVDAGEITADEARVHPSRSVITTSPSTSAQATACCFARTDSRPWWRTPRSRPSPFRPPRRKLLWTTSWLRRCRKADMTT